MYITMCLYITITILLCVLSIYHFIKHYTIVVSIITIQFSHISVYLTLYHCHSIQTMQHSHIFNIHIMTNCLYRHVHRELFELLP